MTVLATNQNSRAKQVLKNALIVVSAVALFVAITALIFFIKSVCDKFKFDRTYDRINYLSMCVALFNISEHNAGCLRYATKSFYNASSFCYFNDMQLLEIESEEEMAVVVRESLKFFEMFEEPPRVWINGRWSGYDKKWVTHPKNMKLEFKLGDSLRKYGESDKNCLAIESSNSTGSFNFASVPCDDLNFYYCEF
jgi:hypothetical protein